MKVTFLYLIIGGCPEGYRSIKGDMSGGVLDQYQCSFDKCRINCDVNDECKTFRYTHGEQYACTLISTETPDVLKTGDFTLCKKQGISLNTILIYLKLNVLILPSKLQNIFSIIKLKDMSVGNY